MNLFDVILGLLMVIFRLYKRRQYLWDYLRKIRLLMKKVFKCVRSILYVWLGFNNIFFNGKVERGQGREEGRERKKQRKKKGRERGKRILRIK